MLFRSTPSTFDEMEDVEEEIGGIGEGNTEEEANGTDEEGTEEEVNGNGDIGEIDNEITNEPNPDNSSGEAENTFVSPEPDKGWTPVEKKDDENYGKITLNQANNWEHIWEMPLYEKDEQGKWKKVIYTVQELKGDWMIPEKSPEGWYEVKYTGNAMNGGVTITNTFKDSINGEISISKECVGNDGKIGRAHV